MIRNRLLSVVVLIPVVLGVTYVGGFWFLGLALLALTLAGYEYVNLIKRNGQGPSLAWVLLTTWLFVLDATFPQVRLFRLALTASLLGVMAWAVVRYERKHPTVVVDWAWTLAGGLYLGWMGAHFVLLRQVGLRDDWSALAHGDGLWWTTLTLGAIWLTDTGAYFAGRAWGRDKMSPLVSPAKTWAGYVGGIVTGTLGGVGVALLIQSLAPLLGHPTAITIGDGLGLSALVSMLAPLGDLGESMLKRHAGVKDSGRLIPGHGGMFDRIDSLLWAAVIGYYYVLWIAQV